ncbi:LCP family protein [Nocardioides kribbensis]|uniref:LCP family protein n=1 Tax=Nocardioides kribbensis TaxID=305517 RepID=UPI0032DB63B0
MADGPGRGGDDEKRFDWLYGGQGASDPDATRPVRRQPRPASPAAGSGAPDDEATRVMRARPRDQPRDLPRDQPRDQPRAATPPPRAPVAPPPAAASSGRRRPRFRARYVLVLVLLWVVYLVAVPVFAWTKVDKVAFEPRGERPAEQPGTTYLLVGSDSRQGLSAAERKEYGTGDASGQRTDTILLLHTGSGPNLLMSIPRDSLVDVPGSGTTKINAAYAFGGPRLLTRTIEENTGIRVDEYVEIGIGGFVDLVDAVGGIEICPRQAMDDPLANLDIEKGCQEADGVTALGYARSRHTSGLGDIERARQQREVVASIGREVVSPWSVLNPVRYWRLNLAATETVTFGDGMNPARAAMWASAMTRVNGDNGLTCSVPISDLAVNWDPERSRQMFQAIIDDDTDSIDDSLCTPSGLPEGATS